MSKIFIPSGVFLMICVLSTCNLFGDIKNIDLTPTEWNTSGYNLVWSDEFDGATNAPDSAKWDYDTGKGPNGDGWGNNEVQSYTNTRTNSYVQDGKLFIKALKSGTWTSARLVTRGKGYWTYGMFEIRAKLPTGVGTWPAIWMLPEPPADYGAWPLSGEIDIMEHLGKDQNKVFGTAHHSTLDNKHQYDNMGEKIIPTATTEFHSYQIRWSDKAIDLFFDGEYQGSYSRNGAGWQYYPFDKPFYLIMNIAMGGNLGGEIAASLTEAVMEVDYVRVWQK